MYFFLFTSNLDEFSSQTYPLRTFLSREISVSESWIVRSPKVFHSQLVFTQLIKNTAFQKIVRFKYFLDFFSNAACANITANRCNHYVIFNITNFIFLRNPTQIIDYPVMLSVHLCIGTLNLKVKNISNNKIQLYSARILRM